jgi:hypothetical protein
MAGFRPSDVDIIIQKNITAFPKANSICSLGVLGTLVYRQPANLNKSVSKTPLMAFFVTRWQLAFSYSLDTGERLIACHL